MQTIEARFDAARRSGLPLYFQDVLCNVDLRQVVFEACDFKTQGVLTRCCHGELFRCCLDSSAVFCWLLS